MKFLNRFLFPFTLLLSFVSVWAVLRTCSITPAHPLTAFLFILFTFWYQTQFRQGDFDNSRREIVTSVILSFLFTFFTLCGNYRVLTDGLSNPLFCLIHLLVSNLGFFFLYFSVLLFLFRHTKQLTICLSSQTVSRSAWYQRLPLLSFAGCLVCWFPYFASNYPGVMTVDSLNQYGQIIGALPYSNHHPFIHTLLIGFWYRIGMFLFHDPIHALALFTVFQMLVMAACVFYLIHTMIFFKVKSGCCIAVCLFYALIPYNGIYAVTMWKDILFSGMVLLFSTALLRFLFCVRQDEKPSLWLCFIYLFSGSGMCLLRSNGWYAFLITLPFLLFFFKKHIKLHLILNLLILFLTLIVKIPVMNSLHVIQPDFAESLSIPIQQVARVYADNLSVDAKDTENWNKVIDTSKIPEVYYNHCSDNMKTLLRSGNSDYLAAHKGEYLRLWITFGLKHPKAYFLAYIDATEGFWYPDVPVLNQIGSDERIAENKYGLSARPFLTGPAVVKIKEILFKLQDMIPVYGLLFSVGASVWFSCFLFGKTMLHHAKDNLVVFLPNAAIIATMLLATPVSSEFRYGYPLIYSIPLFLLIAFSDFK